MNNLECFYENIKDFEIKIRNSKSINELLAHNKKIQKTLLDLILLNARDEEKCQNITVCCIDGGVF